MERGAFSFSHVGPKCCRCEQGSLLVWGHSTPLGDGDLANVTADAVLLCREERFALLVKEGEIMAYVECNMAVWDITWNVKDQEEFLELMVPMEELDTTLHQAQSVHRGTKGQSKEINPTDTQIQSTPWQKPIMPAHGRGLELDVL